MSECFIAFLSLFLRVYKYKWRGEGDHLPISLEDVCVSGASVCACHCAH